MRPFDVHAGVVGSLVAFKDIVFPYVDSVFSRFNFCLISIKTEINQIRGFLFMRFSQLFFSHKAFF